MGTLARFFRAKRTKKWYKNVARRVFLSFSGKFKYWGKAISSRMFKLQEKFIPRGQLPVLMICAKNFSTYGYLNKQCSGVGEPKESGWKRKGTKYTSRKFFILSRGSIYDGLGGVIISYAHGCPSPNLISGSKSQELQKKVLEVTFRGPILEIIRVVDDVDVV